MNRDEERSGEPWRDDQELLNGQVKIERKMFSFSLRENPRGRFLRITEDVGRRREAIIIPSTGLIQFRDLIDRAIKTDSGSASPDQT